MTSTLIEGGLQLVDDGRQTVPVGRTSVLVVDDHRTFAELLARALDAESDLECVGHAQDSGEALDAVERLRPDVVLMDVHLPDRDGICTTAELVRDHPDLKVLILTAHAGWNGERTRGASALEDWADVVITLVRDPDNDQVRYLRAEGATCWSRRTGSTSTRPPGRCG